MRLAEQADETIAAALEGGITVFDTARAYEGNEQLLARALREAKDVRIVTKGGMARPGGAWVPDGRAKAIRADCEASLEALGGLPIDLYLLHAPDPRTPWSTSVRALARLVDDGLVARIGVCNVNRTQLDEAVGLAPLAAVQVAISPFDDRALRGGVVERCAELGIAAIAHSPLGGPRRARTLERHEVLTSIAQAHRATQAEVALAWLLGIGPNVVAIPGARRPETARSSASAATLSLDPGERERLAPTRARPSRPQGDGDVLVVMGIPGAGKSRVAGEHVARGYVRLNRDERGGSLADIAHALDEALASGSREVVLDNTYLTRAVRSHVVETAARHGAPARCLWLDTPLAQAQVNLVERLLDRFGTLPRPEELKEAARSEARPALADPADAHVSRARASGRRRRLRIRRTRAVRADARARAHWSLRRCRRRESGGLGRRARRRRLPRPASRLRLAARRRAGRGRRRGCGRRARRLGPGRGSHLPAPRRCADLLVPPAASGTPPRVRAPSRRRSGTLARRRDGSGAPHARDDAGCSLRDDLSAGASAAVRPAAAVQHHRIVGKR